MICIINILISFIKVKDELMGIPKYNEEITMYKIRTTSKVAFLIGLFIFLSGCAGSAYHHYSGNHLPETELAAIKPWHDFSDSLTVFPTAIDGKVTEEFRAIAMPTHYVLPGKHEIKIALTTLEGRIDDPDPMSFEAKANHTYITRAFIVKLKQTSDEMELKISFWIEDEKTQEVVAGTRLTE